MQIEPDATDPDLVPEVELDPPPEVESIISLTETKMHLRLDEHQSEEDLYILVLIDAAVAQIEADTGICVNPTPASQDFIFDALTAKQNGFILKKSPVHKIASVSYIDKCGIAHVPDELIVGLQRLDCGQVALTPVKVSEGWPEEIVTSKSFSVEYLAGYIAETLPPALKVAAFLLVGHWFLNREAAVVGVSVNTLPLAYESLVRRYRIQVVG